MTTLEFYPQPITPTWMLKTQKYVKKVKDTTGKNLKQLFGDVVIAEEIVNKIQNEYAVLFSAFFEKMTEISKR